MEVKGYQDLKVWQKAMDLVTICYKKTLEFPTDEIYGLTSQIKRAAVSIPANIAEGYGRRYPKEYIRHLSIAYGSLAELETHFQIAHRLNYVDENHLGIILSKSNEIGRMLNGLSKSIESKI